MEIAGGRIMRGQQRKIVVQLVEKGSVNNHRLAEYFANKIKERGLNNV